MIPEEAVTAAAKVIYADNISNHAGDNAPQIIAACELVARKALEAAAPHLMAASWDEAMKVADVLAWEHDASAASAIRMAPNPYRTNE